MRHLFHFNPRSHEGSDTIWAAASPEGGYFNPRSHEGSDTIKDIKEKFISISIHAPTRGATTSAVATTLHQRFQSTLPRGERLILTLTTLIMRIFQSTLPRGERLHIRFFILNLANFNPRSHEGSDLFVLLSSAPGAGISIHAPTRGATILTLTTLIMRIFQSTLPRGERPLLPHDNVFVGGNFNPRSHEGSDRLYSSCYGIHWYFNPRSHEGSDVLGKECCVAIHRFQSTLPRGERQQFSPKSSLFSQQKLSKIFNLNNKLF